MASNLITLTNMKPKAIRLALLTLCSAMIAFCMYRVLNGDKAPATGVTVYAFLTEDCPISQSATLALKSLYREYNGNGIDFVGVFANSASTEAGMAQFQQKYE